MSASSRKLVVVDPYYDFLVRQFKEDGLELYAVFSGPIKESAAHRFEQENFNKVYQYDFDYDAMLSELRALKVDAVVSGFDEGFSLTLELSHDLGLEDPPPPGSAKYFG